ncbi:Tyrosine recombinase XerD, partial [Dysosmobacter welbionis]
HRRVRVVVGIVHRDHGTVGLVHVVDDGGQGGHQIQVELPLQPLLDHLHVEHAQKAAPEAEAQGYGALRLKAQRGVVQLELFQRVPQVRILGAVLRVDTAVDHGLHGPVAGQGLGRGAGGICDGVAHTGVLHVLDGGGEVAHLAGPEAVAGLHAQGQQMAAFDDLISGSRGHHLHLLARAEGPLHDAEVDDDAPIRVILTVEDQRLQRRIRVPLGGRHVLYDILQHRLDVGAHLSGDFRRVHGRQADDVLHLLLGLGGVRRRQVDLVEHRQNLQVVLHGQICVGQSLGLHALGGVHHQHGALAGGQRAGHLVVEVHVARGVDQIQFIVLPVLGMVGQPDGPG